MKLLTLNTHSLLQTDALQNLDRFAAFLLGERPDIVALQEVNQSIDASPADHSCGMVCLPDVSIPLKADNYALSVVRKLCSGGVSCSWTYLPVKLGYDAFDEGLAILSLNGEICQTDAYTVSHTDDYHNWRRRQVLGVRIENHPHWFYCVHMGFWQDAEEPFVSQWMALEAHLAGHKKRSPVWLMGDFNAPAEMRKQSYDLIASSGWHDAHLLAQNRDDGCTVPGKIDGWGQAADPMRMDHIWCSVDMPIASCRTVFNGRDEKPISDHFGVLVRIMQKTQTSREGQT